MSKVWISLYYKNEKDPDGDPYELLVSGPDVNSLKVAVKEEEQPKCHVRKIEVYAPGTDLSSEAKKEHPATKLTDYPHRHGASSFVVVVPRGSRQGANGEKCLVWLVLLLLNLSKLTC